MKSNSLQAKLTWPLAVSVTVCTLVILVVVTDLTYRTYRNELAIRSEQIGKSAQEALEITPESARRSQLISEYGASEAVRYMAIAEGSPLRVQTATQRKFIGQPLAAVSPQATRLARTARATGRSQTAWLSDGGGLVRAVPLRVPGETPSLKGVREAVLLVQVNDDYLQSSVRRNGTAVFLVMILLFSGLVGLLYSMVRTQVIRPVGQLRDFVEARLAGNTRARFSSSADDELAQLGASFERLLTDIDVERQRGTDALTELETVNRRLAGVINAAADAIIACGEDGTIGLINPAGEKLLGYTLADLAGLTLSDLVPGIASARPDAGEYIQAQALTRAGQLVPVEMTLSRSDGSQGTPLLAILRDITERLEAEQELRISQERLELAARGGQLGTWDWNTETGVCHVNEIWLEVNGLATERPSSDTVHAAWMERMDSASLQRSAEALSMIDLGDHDVMEVTVRLRIAEGEWRWIHNRGEVIERSETGKAVRLAGVSRDITAMVAARRELEVTRDDALQAFKARSEFLANISHELRTPLNGVLGMLTLLHGSRLDSEQREFVHVAERSGRSLATLINDVLDFSKLEAGEVLPEDIPFSLRELAEDVVRMCAESAQRKNVDIALIVHRAVAPILRGDPARTGQVLTNLVTNAVKFTEVGEVTVEIMPDPSLEDMLRITVRDTGIGIPADLQSGIFEAFSQADGSTTRKYGGSGLGLTISRQLVEAMHGTISVESVPGEGSSFHISLPLPSAGDEKSGGLPSAADLSSKRVLVIDDSASRLRAVQEILEPAGCDVVGVTDPDKQVAALARLAANGEGVDVVMIAHEDDPASTGQLIETTRQSEASAAARIILTMPFTAALSAGIRAMQVDAKLTRPVCGKALLEAVAAGPN
ncbi:MAG: PAS domain S-box protein, partial [Gammaproteobacteria bacterium]|nr:PAS domain S-box protein [Gammaproteobacteria bacterium]